MFSSLYFLSSKRKQPTPTSTSQTYTHPLYAAYYTLPVVLPFVFCYNVSQLFKQNPTNTSTDISNKLPTYQNDLKDKKNNTSTIYCPTYTITHFLSSLPLAYFTIPSQ
jgi:hypothetical protein